MISELDIDQRKLAEYMSELSEKAYSAGWMDGLEYALWLALAEGPRVYGRLNIGEIEIKILKDLMSLTGGWIYFDEENEETFIELDNWKKMYEQNISSYENRIS